VIGEGDPVEEVGANGVMVDPTFAEGGVVADADEDTSVVEEGDDIGVPNGNPGAVNGSEEPNGNPEVNGLEEPNGKDMRTRDLTAKH
jgi:hypothetical protein